MKTLYKTSSSGTRRATTRIINSLIDELNSQHKIPRFLVVIIDKDVIADVDLYDKEASPRMIDNLNWLVKQIDIAINRKKSDIMTKRPGAIFKGDPKIIFVRMLRRFQKNTPGTKLDLLYGLRGKFNDALNTAAAQIDQKMLTITSCNSLDHFNFYGNLSSKGKVEYWKELDELLNKCDRREIKLNPTPVAVLHPPILKNVKVKN